MYVTVCLHAMNAIIIVRNCVAMSPIFKSQYCEIPILHEDDLISIEAIGSSII